MNDSSLNRHGVDIVIVEDSPAQADLLYHTLAKNRYEIAAARNGREALALVRAARPSVVISDIVMPEMDGFQLCSAIRNDDRLKDTPVILLTALSDPGDVLRGLECGADGFITKPFDEEYLLSRIQHVVKNVSLRKAGSAPGVEISFRGQKYCIASERREILDLLISTYETAVQRNRELKEVKEKLEVLNENLEEKVKERTAALRAEIEERRKIQEELQKHREHLEELVSGRTAELLASNRQLHKEIAERTAAENEIKRLNVRLEQHARKLEEANKDLESFSYSVSHDLKAPLRAIGGFSGILKGRHLKDMPPDAVHLLDQISGNAARMAQLIDDILDFSHAGRQELVLREVDMEQLARSVVEELKPSEKCPRFVFKSLPAALGDESALRQVFSNLISNAIKFTRLKETPCIEIGCRVGEEENTYYVRDNGVGFNDRYVDKLFCVFQRLHSSRDFEGTGVGLAIVKRIVNKLGGRVSAEGKENEGAAFYFTLPGR